MQVYDSISAAHLNGPTHLTIGSFDGVHRGHRALIAAMQKKAHQDGATCGLLTFHPHPRAILFPDKPVAAINSLQERLRLYAESGLDFSIVQPFTPKTAQTAPEIFMKLLKEHLALTDLWVGADFALGKNRQGDVPFLRARGEKMGIRVHTTPEFCWEDIPVRSSRIRTAIAAGNIDWANVWLARPVSISGVIVYGDQRGRTLGFPTANLSLSENRVRPADGVYAAWAEVEGKRHPAVVNIGVRPTIDGLNRTIEAHLIDFDADIYGRCLTLDFVARLRDEMKFSGLDALKAQIGRDKALAAWLLAQEQPIPDYERWRNAASGLEILGRTQAELMAHAGLALIDAEAGFWATGAMVQHFVEAEGMNPATLIVNWLREVKDIVTATQFLPQKIIVQELTTTHIRALLLGRATVQTPALRALSPNPVITAPGTEEALWRAQGLFDR